MNLSPANKVRWHILMLAIVGSVGFAAYLLVVFTIAMQNEERLQGIVEVKQPVIELLRNVEVTAEDFRGALSNAISLEDPYLIEDAQDMASRIAADLEKLQALYPGHSEDIAALLRRFRDNANQSITISSQLVEDPGKIYELQSAVEVMTREQNAIAEQMASLMNRSLADYSNDLNQTARAMQNTRHWGIGMGLLTIILLITLALTISVSARKAILRSDRLKEEFLATVSHELRTPMNGIMGALELLRETRLDNNQQELLGAASTSSRDMLLAVTDILAFSDFLTGNVTVKAAKFNGRELFAPLTERTREACEAKQLVLQTNIAHFPFNYIGDMQHISHVLRHVLDNAVKFTDTGTIWFDATVLAAHPETAEGDCKLVVIVRDSGNGVPESLIEELFKPFRQLDGSFSRKAGGLGIGLSICRHITQALHGSITFRNHLGGGAEVTIMVPLHFELADISAVETGTTAEIPSNLPATPALPSTPGVTDGVTDETPAMPPPAAPQATPIAATVAHDAPLNLQVLVVEDNKVNQMVINGYLKKLGCTVTTANHGQEAVMKVMAQPFDVVLMDCQMPVMDGFEATRTIRGLDTDFATTLPIIAVTANAMEGDRERCLACGMNDYLTKPIDINTLREAILGNVAARAPLPDARAVAG